jgi:hypothetical protein
VAEPEEFAIGKDIHGCTGIGYTRWATGEQ